MGDQLQSIIDNYRILCDYCDRLWDKVRAAYPNEIACRNGCDICCELQSVNRLEAHVIKEYLSTLSDDDEQSNISHDNSRMSSSQSYSNSGDFSSISYGNGGISSALSHCDNEDTSDISYNNDGILSTNQNEDCGSCPFIASHSCSIYPARPTICRTHGLVLRSTEFPHGQATSCPYNFPSFHPNDIPEDLTVDIDRITKNLTNLNLAFCMVTGVDIKSNAEDRVMLRDITHQNSTTYPSPSY